MLIFRVACICSEALAPPPQFRPLNKHGRAMAPMPGRGALGDAILHVGRVYTPHHTVVGPRAALLSFGPRAGVKLLYLHMREFASYVLWCTLSDSTHKRCCPRGSARREHPTHICIGMLHSPRMFVVNTSICRRVGSRRCSCRNSACITFVFAEWGV